MTDKQIIIDGADVSGCSYYADGKCTNSHMIQSNCKNVATCYYKEYKRKEQECKNNKIAHQMELDIYNQACLNLQEELKETFEQLDQLKEENEELKTENNTYKSSIIANLNNNISKRYRELLEENDQLKKELTISIQENEEGREINAELKAENYELKKQLESTKGLVTVGNKQLAEALLVLKKYKDNEQQEKEMQQLYNKFNGNSLIEKRSHYEN